MREFEKINEKKYVRLFIAFSNRIESWLIRIVAGLLVLLLLFQCLLQFTPFRQFLSLTDQLEGKPFNTNNLDAFLNTEPGSDE